MALFRTFTVEDLYNKIAMFVIAEILGLTFDYLNVNTYVLATILMLYTLMLYVTVGLHIVKAFNCLSKINVGAIRGFVRDQKRVILNLKSSFVEGAIYLGIGIFGFFPVLPDWLSLMTAFSASLGMTVLCCELHSGARKLQLISEVQASR